ncbi:MAG: methylenetetrahydrofolate--tRNA-(uracil(54)-C(5))-methyltransferase (FADH(2)-oxidizing) TrmFO [Caldilineaceae bacterium]|nr:methylenetetrahydrofolate--tRNA-(uracil(54)-C(5))-methyltransferase (FADH(2)-oxidizing) TrmFO [Caldilineaceae bacterium]
MEKTVTIVGGGLAGTEAAWQIAERGHLVKLYEMRPKRETPAHITDRLAELVCSNSMGSTLPDRALGILKNEMMAMGSMIIRTAFKHALPAGQALAVGREEFADDVTEKISSHPNIELIRDEVIAIPDGPTILATGPLTSPALTAEVQTLTGRYLYFYDAMAPIVTADSINMEVAFRQSRWDRDSGAGPEEGDYINCPLNKEEYEAFVNAVVAAPKLELSGADAELERYFEGCMPIEVLASRGIDSLAYGPMRPVGLTDPRTGRRPYAVVQLRQDNVAGTLYNMVGFQTNIKWGAQAEILKMIPGLENAEFVRLGQMHRNTFINSPTLLHPTLQFKDRSDLFFAGQITGTEGYVGSTMGGLLAGINMTRRLEGRSLLTPPRETMMGALLYYITHAEADNFQPMKANMGLLPELSTRVRNKQKRYGSYAERAEDALRVYLADVGFEPIGEAERYVEIGRLGD